MRSSGGQVAPSGQRQESPLGQQQQVAGRANSPATNAIGTSPATPTSSSTALSRLHESSGSQSQQHAVQQQQHIHTPAVAPAPTTNIPRRAEEQISFHLKTSIFTRRVTIDADKLALGIVKQLAIAFINEIYFQQTYPPETYVGSYVKKHFSNTDNLLSLFDRLVLRIYLPEQDSFVPFYSVSDIRPETYICIEISEKQSQANHLLTNPTSGTNTFSSSSSSSTSSQHSVGQRPTSNYQLKISHDFHAETYLMPTHCFSCSTLIKGLYKQGFQCGSCKKNFCPKCKIKANSNGESCLAVTPTSTTAPPSATSITATNPNLLSSLTTSLITSSASSANISGASQSPVPATSPNSFVSQQNQFIGRSHVNKHDNDHSSDGISQNTTDNTTEDANVKLEPSHSNMTKRKSANNLLLFNIANPFKSHHAQQQQPNQQSSRNQPAHKEDQVPSKSVRGSTGALEPVLKQLSKQMQLSGNTSKQQPDNAAPKQDKDTRMLSVQSSQLSASHQNLYTNNFEEEFFAATVESEDKPAGSSSVNQSPSKGAQNQLSNSARTSARDLMHAMSPTRRSQTSNHSFIEYDPNSPTGEDNLCGVCSKSLRSTPEKNNSTAPSICKICRLQVHHVCSSLVLADCMSRVAESSRAAAEKNAAINTNDSDKAKVDTSNSNVSRDNIRLHRLAPSVKHVKRPDLTVPIIEGWLQHKTSSDEPTRRHYWRLDDKDITMYENDTSTRYFKAIPIDKIVRVMSSSSLPGKVKEDMIVTNRKKSSDDGKSKSVTSSPVKTRELEDQMKAVFAFEVTTGSVYLVQASDKTEATKWRDSLQEITSSRRPESKQEAARDSAGKNGKLNQVDERATPSRPPRAASDKDKEPNVLSERPRNINQRYYHNAPSNFRGQHKTYTDPNRSRLYNRPRTKITLDPMRIPDHLVEGKYLIECNRDRNGFVQGYKELGSGQFGKVYAAISEIKAENPTKGIWSGVPVAIKEISKARFDLRQQAKLRNEANILSRLDHPGVIILERVHDLPDKLYIVMEQLEDDMLEMIVSKKEKRLDERLTKFLTYQILEALKYLHSQNIAHCDLKPENVLLVDISHTEFPQIKLCDFGFAKIIEDNSFRSSLVGTPAYLAPEVVKGERYNRSVDLWSVGVIVYVSLSGEFPFNEGENIHDQISRANFMYPEQPWSKISQQAKGFITNLLRVNCDKRLSANRAQMDPWIQDFQLWCDLCNLEERVGRRWVTDDADFERWSRYAAVHNLKVPESAIRLHQQLMENQ